MNRFNKITGNNPKVFLSTLWIFILFNIIFRDIHEMFRPGMLEQMLSGTVNGTQMTNELLLIGSMMIEIPVLMVLLSRLLNYRINRWANVFTALFMVAAIYMNSGNPDLDDLFFAGIELITLAVIIWTVWQWPNPLRQLETKQNIINKETYA